MLKVCMFYCRIEFVLAKTAVGAKARSVDDEGDSHPIVIEF